ncbi:hypothetical protein C0J52_06504 [Blattella germanica]|nr:hypothetical protein C0J52_06504 [Blattella germanica]
MLNSDPKGVRINVAAANKIYSYLNSAVLDSSSSEKLNLEQVGNLLHGLITTKEQTAEQILVLLETALDHSYSSLILSDDTITNQLLHWDLAVKFAKFHKIKLPEQFLKHCARQNLWLPFVLFIQLHQYPVEQVMILVKKFESGNLQEHLSHALSLKMYVKQPPSEIKIRSKLKARDSRKMLYSRIGVHKEEGNSESPAGSPNHTPNTATVSSSSSEDSFQSRLSAPSDVDVLPEAHRDLFFALLNCHRSQDPPRALLVACQYLQNPVMAVFATCYEPSSALACFCTWVVTSLANHIPLRLKSELSTALQHHTWTPRQVQFLLEEIVAVGYVETLSRGFTIFFPPSVMECDDSEGTFLNNGHWIATVAVRTTCIALANCFPSSYHQQLFLNTLCETSFTDHLPVNAPDFSLLANVAECLSGSGVHADWATLCHSKTSSDYQAELQQCLHRLIEVGKYQQALEFSKLVGLPKDSIVVAQWSNELKLDLTTSSQTESDIFDNWRKCHEAFIEANVSAQTAATFFREYSNKTLQQKERKDGSLVEIRLTKASKKWLREVKYQEAVEENRSDPEDEDDVELEMWKCLLSSDIELSKLSFDELAISDTKLLCNTKAELQHASRASTFHNKTELTDDVEIDRLDALIGNLLDQGDVSLACRLEAMFNHKNQDILKLKDPLELLRTALSEECSNKLQLASDIIGASQISSEDLATLLCDEIISAIRNYFQATSQAELVALQLSILNTVPAGQGVDSLLKLEREEVVNAIKHKLRAYNHNVDWGESLYQHCIVQGDVNYLPDFVYNKPLTSALVEDVATRLVRFSKTLG